MVVLYRKLMRIIRTKLYGHRVDQETYIKYLRDRGAKIGNRVRIFYPHETFIDDTRPWMLTIGDDVQITSGVRILSHGYDWSVLKGLYGEVLGSCGEVSIGNNVFIGMNTTILKGVHIGDNCIIGANSLVVSDVESGWVAAGNPAKPIIRIEDQYRKMKDRQLSEAVGLYKNYVEKIGYEPEEDKFDEFFWLFKCREKELSKGQTQKMNCVGNYDYSMNTFYKTRPMFNGFEAFIDYCRKMCDISTGEK